jgi:hypothetical protein
MVPQKAAIRPPPTAKALAVARKGDPEVVQRVEKTGFRLSNKEANMCNFTALR